MRKCFVNREGFFLLGWQEFPKFLHWQGPSIATGAVS